MLDVIDSKLYRPKISNKNPPPKIIRIINFQNKAIGHIKLSKILNKSEVMVQVPRKFKIKNTDL